MGFNLGAFAGGLADGYRKQNEEQRKADEAKRVDDAAKREEAYRKDMEAAAADNPWVKYQAAVAEHKRKVAAQSEQQLQQEAVARAAATATTPAPATSALGLEAVAPRQPENFSDSVAQRRTDSMMPPAQQASPEPNRTSPVVGMGAADQLSAAIATPEKVASPAPLEAPKPPSILDQMDYVTNLAAVDVSHGKANGQGILQLAMARKQIEDEGGRHAMLALHSGDANGFVSEYNAAGKDRVKLVSSRPVEADVGGIKMKTTEAVVEDAQGNRQTINAGAALYALMGMDKQLALAMNIEDKKQRADFHKDTAEETARHNKAEEGLAGARIKALNSTGGGGHDPARLAEAKALKADWIRNHPNAEEPPLEQFYQQVRNKDQGDVTRYHDSQSGTITEINNRTGEIALIKRGVRTVMPSGGLGNVQPASSANPIPSSKKDFSTLFNGGGAPTNTNPAQIANQTIVDVTPQEPSLETQAAARAREKQKVQDLYDKAKRKLDSNPNGVTGEHARRQLEAAQRALSAFQ